MIKGGAADLQMSFTEEDLIGWIGLDLKVAVDTGCDEATAEEE
jgi:hypothetical protein